MKKIIKKADEMEMEINMKAARFAFGFLEIAIMGYCIAEKITTGEFPTPIFIFGILGMLIFNGIKLYKTPAGRPGGRAWRDKADGHCD